MNKQQLISEIRAKQTCLCVGLDTDIDKLPAHLSKDAAGMLAFNKAIIDATADLCVAYKVNTAFYESLGAAGWQVLEETAAYIPDTHFRIADAKRGDIGNTSLQYAKAFFETMPFDAVTVAPYMGKDSVSPFLTAQGKWAIILGLTSNPGSEDFQRLPAGDQPLWEQVLQTTSTYGSDENIMYVVGATRAQDLERVREIVPDHFLLVPGVGAQGGSMEEVIRNGKTADIGLLINASRAIIFAGTGRDFDSKAREAALAYHDEMKTYL